MAVFIAETVPNFGPVLDLIGGTAASMTSMVFPCLFYLYLATRQQIQAEQNSRQQSAAVVSDPQISVRFSEFVFVLAANIITIIGYEIYFRIVSFFRIIIRFF